MRQMVLVVAPIAVALAILGAAALLLPACAVAGLSWSNACPAAVDVAGADRVDAQAARRAALEAEIAALQRRVAALPACAPVVAAVEPEPEPAPQPARQPQPPRGIDQDRWNDRDVSLLEGCWNLDSQLSIRDVSTNRASPVQSWKMCFDARGVGRQTLVFTNGQRCEGPVTGSFASSGALQVDDGSDLSCSGGFTIFRRVGTCTLNRNGTAACTSTQPSQRNSGSSFTLRR